MEIYALSLRQITNLFEINGLISDLMGEDNKDVRDGVLGKKGYLTKDEFAHFGSIVGKL